MTFDLLEMLGGLGGLVCSCARVSLSQLFGHLPASSLFSPAALRVSSTSSRTSQVRPVRSGPVWSGLQRASAQLEEEEEENSASLWRDDTAVKRKKNNTGSERWCEKTAGEVSVCLPVCSHSQCVRQQQALGVVGGLGTRLAVSVGHDEA